MLPYWRTTRTDTSIPSRWAKASKALSATWNLCEAQLPLDGFSKGCLMRFIEGRYIKNWSYRIYFLRFPAKNTKRSEWIRIDTFISLNAWYKWIILGFIRDHHIVLSMDIQVFIMQNSIGIGSKESSPSFKHRWLENEPFNDEISYWRYGCFLKSPKW